MVHAGAAVLIRHGDAEEAELGHAADQLVRVAVLAVDRGGGRRDFRPCEVAGGAEKELLLLAEFEVHLYSPRNAAGRLARKAAIPSR